MNYYRQGYNSAQAVFAAFHAEMGISEREALKTASSFGAGISTMQKTCGALSGALMVTGRLFFDPESLFESKQILFDKNQELLLLFHKEFGGTECCSLLDIDFHKPGGLQKAREKRVFETHCMVYIRKVCRHLDKMIETMGKVS